MQIIPIGGALGAEIRGVDVTKPLAPAEVAASKRPFSNTSRRILKRTQMFGDAPFLEL